MPFVTYAGARLYWRADGDPSLPPLVLVNSLGADQSLARVTRMCRGSSLRPPPLAAIMLLYSYRPSC